MKILKDFNSIHIKRKRGMTSTDESASYEIIDIPPNPSGQEGEVLEINGEKYYHWIFYAEDPTKNKNLPSHAQKKAKKPFRFREEIEQERYEWFCGGWTQFFDDIVRTGDLGGIEHKLFFFWDRKDIPGVAIYINDVNVTDSTTRFVYDNTKKILTYTAPPAGGDPPSPPPPPPPSAK